MIRHLTVATLLAGLASQSLAYDLGLTDSLADNTGALASDSAVQTPTVSESLLLDMSATALAGANGPLVFDIDGVFFVPFAPDAATRLWQVSFDAEPGTRVALDFTALDRDDAGLVAGFTSMDSFEISQFTEPFEVAIPSAATHVEITTSGPVQIAFAPVPQPGLDALPRVGQTTTIALDEVIHVDLDYVLPEGAMRQNLIAEIRLPVNITGNLSARLGSDTVTYPLTGQPAIAPPFAFGVPIERLQIELSRGSGFADDPWPFAPVTLSLVDVASDEIEPNATMTQATPVIWDADDRRVRLSGRLSDPDDVDIWQLDYTQARSARALEIDVSTEDDTVSILLRDANGEVLTSQRGQGDLSLGSLVLAEGVYFLEVSQGPQTTARYDLQFKSVRRPRDGKEQEPNDTVQTAQNLPLGQVIAGRSAALDIDFYAFQITQAGQMWGAFSPGNVGIALTDSEGTLIAEGIHEAATNLTRLPPTPLPIGNYLVEISGEDNYAIEVRDFGPRPRDWETEPNDAEYRANQVDLGAQIRGQLALNDYDIVYFEVPVAQDVVIEVDAPDDAGIQVDMAFNSGSSFAYTRLSAGESMNQVWELEAGEYSVALSLYPSAPTLDTWRVAVSPYIGQPPVDLEPNGDTARLIAPFSRITGEDGQIDQNDLFEVRLPSEVGHVLFPCRFRPGGEDRFAIGPQGARLGAVERTRLPRNGFAHDGRPGQSFYPYMDHWGAMGYDCAAHWLTPDALRDATKDRPVQEFSWAKGISRGGVRFLTVPALVNIDVPAQEDGYYQTFAVDFGDQAEAVHVKCDYDDGLISAGIYDDAGQLLNSGRMGQDYLLETEVATQTGFVAFRQQVDVTSSYICGLGHTKEETLALFDSPESSMAFDLAGIPSRDNQTIDALGTFTQTLLPGDLRVIPNFVSEARQKNGLIGVQCHFMDAQGQQTMLPHAIFPAQRQWTYTPDLPNGAVSYQCAFVDVDDLPMLPLPADDFEPADVDLALVANDTVVFAPYRDAAQSAAMTVVLANNAATPVTVDLQVALAALRWDVATQSDTVTLAPGAQLPVTLMVQAPPFLLEQDKPAVTVIARSAGTVVLDAILPIAVSADVPARNPVAGWRVPAALAGGINLAELRFGGQVVKVGDKVADGEDDVIDGNAATQGGGMPRFADRQPSFTVDLAGTGAQPVAGFFYTLRRQSLPLNGPMRQMLIEYSVDGGASFDTVATYDLSLGTDRQYFVLPETLQADHIRVTNPDCRTRFCVAMTEFGIVGQPGYVPSTLAAAANIADIAYGGHLVTTSGEIGPYSQNTLLTNETLSVTVPEPDGGGDVAPLEFVVGFHNTRSAQVASLIWGDAQSEEPTITFDVFGMADALSPPVLLGQMASPQPGQPATLTLPDATVVRLLRLVANVSAGKHKIPGQLRVMEAPTQADGYRSVLGVWDEDDARGYTDWIVPRSAAMIPEQVVSSRADPLVLPQAATVRSHTYKEVGPDYFRMLGGAAADDLMWRIVTLDAPRHVEVGPILTNGTGDVVPLVWVEDLLRERPDLEATLQDLLPESPEGWADQIHYLAQVDPSQSYVLRIAEEGRLMVIRRERTRMLLKSDTVRKRSYAELAVILGDGRDGLDVGVAGLDGETVLRGEDEILLGMSRLPGPDDDEGVSTTDFGNAVIASADRFRTWPGGKTLVYFGMGGGLMQVEDMDWIFALQDTPVRTNAILAPCDAGNFFCPDASETDINAMAFAASTNGRFTRTTTRADLRRAFLQAAYSMQGPKPYRVSWRDVTLPPAPATLTVVATATAQVGPLEDDAANGDATASDVFGPPALALILDASGSMLKRLGDERRINIAKSALGDLIETSIPDDTLVSFRAFGLAEDACETRNLAPLEPLDRTGLITVIDGVRAINLAKTPIAASLLAAVREDLSESTGPKALILVTDGEETCDGDVETVLEDMQREGIQINLSIVGFAIDDAALKAEFSRWSALGNGQYFDASNAPDLRDALQEALTATVPDPAPASVVITSLEGSDFAPLTVALEDTATLPAGAYLLTLDTGEMRQISVLAGSDQKIGVDSFDTP